MRFLRSPLLLGGIAVIVLGSITLLAAISVPGTGRKGTASLGAANAPSSATAPNPANPEGTMPPQTGTASPGGTTTVAGVEDDVPPLPMVSPVQATGFAGSEACRECHASQFTAHRNSAHARTLAHASEKNLLAMFRAQQKVFDPTRKATYTALVTSEKPVIRVAVAGRPAMELEPRYVFGSGTQAHTFVFQKDDERLFMEGRISYFSRHKKWDWTPGAEPPRPGSESPLGRVFSPVTSLECFLCHSTMVVVKEKQIFPEESMFNVGCERCHGAGREHIRAVREGRGSTAIYGFAGANAQRIMKLCSDCHRGPGAIPEERIATSINTSRFSGTALAASKCFQQTPGGLSCLKCHDAHDTSPRDPARYERVCMSCHTGAHAKSKACPVNRNSGCVSCHMPTRKIDNLTFHTHWIHAFGGKGSARAARSSSKTSRR